MARQQLSYVDLSSPVAGSVTLRMAEKGEVVGVGQVVLRVATLDRPWVRAYINEEDLPRVRLGQAAEVRVDGLPGKSFMGRVVFISPEAEFTPKTVETRALRVDQVYRVKVEVAESRRRTQDRHARRRDPHPRRFMMNEVVFRADAVHFAYGDKRVLRGIDITVAAGEIVGLVGADGAGKSTLLRIGVGQLQVSAGSVALLGKPPSDPAIAQ